jgi:hypothetical protein
MKIKVFPSYSLVDCIGFAIGIILPALTKVGILSSSVAKV